MIDLDNFARRVIQDAMTEGLRSTWERRADEFEAARPKRGDFHGDASRADLLERDRRCAEIAQACRNRASIAEFDDLDLIDEALTKVVA